MMTRYIAGFLLAVGLIVLVVILIVRGLTAGPAGPGSQRLNLSDFADTDTRVQYTIDSPVSAEQNHHDVIITVGQTQTTVQVTQGYDGSIIRQQTYPITNNGYAVFLRALQLYGFTQGNNDSSLKDERGQCALHDRVIYEVIDSSGSDLQRYWSTSCGSGTFNGDIATIRSLFINQVPDYGKLTNNISL